MTTFLLSLALLAPAPKTDAKPLPADSHPLIGDWIVDSHVASGRPIAKRAKPERITITVDRWKIGNDGMTESCLTVDVEKKHIDIWVPAQGDDNVPSCSGIFKLEGDTLTICMAEAENGKEDDRPKEFKTSKDGKAVMMKLKKK